jgi:hypothetical protein
MKKKTKPPRGVPMLGAAVMIVRGASQRIQRAIDTGDLARILKERIYGNTTKQELEISKQYAPKDSIITRIYLQLSEIAIEELNEKLQEATKYLSSSLKCVQ